MKVITKIVGVVGLVIAAGIAVTWADTGNPFTDWQQQQDVDQWNAQLTKNSDAEFTRTVSYDKAMDLVRLNIKKNDLTPEQARMGALFAGNLADHLKGQFLSDISENSYIRIVALRGAKIRVVMRDNGDNQFLTFVITKDDL